MEYFEGQNLETVISQQSPLPFELFANMAEHLAEALAYIHGLAVLHRDVKPKNVFVLADGSVRLGDFGIAVVLGETRLTQEGYGIGTPVYMAPEQFEGHEVGKAADIYSFGATLYHAISGQPPFTAQSAMEMLRKHMTLTPAPLSDHREGIPDAWQNLIVNRCLAKRPEDRPDSMAQILSELQDLRQHPFA